MPAHLRLTALCDVNSSNKCSKGASRSSLTSYFCGQLYCPSFQNHLYFVDGCKELKLRMAGKTGNTGKGKARIVYWDRKSCQKIHLLAFSLAFNHILRPSTADGVCSVVTGRMTSSSPTYSWNPRWTNHLDACSPKITKKKWYLATQIVLVLFDQVLRFLTPPQYSGGEWDFVYGAHLRIVFKCAL